MFKKMLLMTAFCLVGVASAVPLTFVTPMEADALAPANANWNPKLGRKILSICARMFSLSRKSDFPTAFIVEFVALTEAWKQKADSACDSYARYHIAGWQKGLERELRLRAGVQ